MAKIKFCMRCACVHNGNHDSTMCTPNPELVAKCLEKLNAMRKNQHNN